MRIAFLGCVEMSYSALEHLVTKVPAAEVVGVATRERSSFNADFRSLRPLARAAGVPCFLARGNDQAPLASWMREVRPDVAYCFGWSVLLDREVLSVPPLGVVGYHPTLLPAHRGRHPVIWTLVLGLDRTASTFFFLDEGVDSGDILSQVPVPVAPDDDAGTLNAKLTRVALGQISEFTPQLASGSYPRVPQDHARASYWRKRGPRDGVIDWRMSARSIHNLVRGLTRPYVGAHFVHQGREVKVWKVERVEGAVPPDREPGRILAADGRRVSVKCGEGAVVLVAHELDSLPEPESCL